VADVDAWLGEVAAEAGVGREVTVGYEFRFAAIVFPGL
jgi:hypothetical protein